LDLTIDKLSCVEKLYHFISCYRKRSALEIAKTMGYRLSSWIPNIAAAGGSARTTCRSGLSLCGTSKNDYDGYLASSRGMLKLICTCRGPKSFQVRHYQLDPALVRRTKTNARKKQVEGGLDESLQILRVQPEQYCRRSPGIRAASLMLPIDPTVKAR
jgi:hypothetical protein